jgi:hypothetical protein
MVEKESTGEEPCRLTAYLMVSAPIETTEVATASVMTSTIVSRRWAAVLGVIVVVPGIILKDAGVGGISVAACEGLRRA